MLQDSLAYRCPLWSPDGRRFVVSGYAAGRSRILVTDLGTGARRTLLAPDTAYVDCPQWSPKGDLLLITVYRGTSGLYEGKARKYGGNLATFDVIFVAKRRFDAGAGERWTRYLVWSGLHQLHELVSLDSVLCPTVPEALTAEDWEHNVHADYQTSYFRSLDYLQRRVAGEPGLNILAIVRDPSPADVDAVLPGFRFLGFDLLDVHGDISALTNCGGFDDVFAREELSEQGLLPDLGRAYEVQRRLLAAYPDDSHARCNVWGIWRQVLRDGSGLPDTIV